MIVDSTPMKEFKNYLVELGCQAEQSRVKTNAREVGKVLLRFKYCVIRYRQAGTPNMKGSSFQVPSPIASRPIARRIPSLTSSTTD